MSESTVWSADQVQAIAPDASSLSAGRKLALSSGWSSTGVAAEPPSLWGLCQGSGKTPYQTCVDLTEPAYRCSCPSRKFPCKHALALLLRWADGKVPAQDPPEWVSEWHASRAARATKKTAQPRTEAQEKAVQRRAEARADRMSSGAAELRQWLGDQVTHGIAGLDQAGYRHFETLAARLVDAQAPALASAVRRLATVPSSGAGWEERLLGEFSLLHLLTGAAAGVDGLPEGLAATVSTRLGQSVQAEQVLALPPVRDVWQVVGVRDIPEDRLTARRAWLIGEQTGREALVLSFAAPGQALAADLIVGTEVDADLCFYPGAPLRAVVSKRHSPPVSCPRPIPAGGVAAALPRLGAALAADPWLTAWPMLIEGVIVPGDRWQLSGVDGQALPLDPAVGDCWRLVATAGGEAAVIAVEWGPAGLTPLAMFHEGSVVLP